MVDLRRDLFAAQIGPKTEIKLFSFYICFI